MRRVAQHRRGHSERAAGARRYGFTLLELLIVIAIIALLIGILLPSLKRSVDLAKATACKSNLRQVGQALYLYRIDNNGWLPQARKSDSMPSGRRGDRAPREPWFGQVVQTYLGDAGVLRCPKDPYGYRVAELKGSRLRDPYASDFSSFGLNNFIMTASETIELNIDRRPPTRPADTILVADIGPDRAPAISRSTSTATPGPERNSGLLSWTDGFDAFSRTQREPWVTVRHGDGIHIVTLSMELRDVNTTRVLSAPVQKYYPGCAAGGCTFCSQLEQFHYSFAKDRLFWWTGSVSAPD